MAKTNENGVDVSNGAATWAQPTRYISVPVGENGRGYFIEVPRMDWLDGIAAVNAGAAAIVLDALCDYMAGEAKAAVNKKDMLKLNDPGKEREIINGVVTEIANGTYDVGDISGRDDFNRALLAAAKDTLRSALSSRGEANPSEARVAEAFKANYERAMARFGAEVAAAGYAPVKKNVSGRPAATAAEKPTLAGLEF